MTDKTTIADSAGDSCKHGMTPDTLAPQTLTIDWALYESYLKDADLTEAEKRDFLQALWSIIVEFVSLGFGIHPLQQTDKSRDNNEKSLSLIEADMLELAHSQEPVKTTNCSDPAKIGLREREES